MHARRNALLLLHLVVFIWGFTGILGKLIEQGALHLVYTRTIIAMGGMALAAWWMRRRAGAVPSWPRSNQRGFA